MTFARPTMDINEDRSDLISRLWYGEVGLARTYWLYWFGGYIGWSFVIGMTSATQVKFLMWFAILAACIYGLFITVGLWRSASEYRRTHMALGWLGALVQVKIILLYALIALGLYVANGVTPPANPTTPVQAQASSAPPADLRAEEARLNANLPEQVDEYSRLIRVDYRNGRWTYHLDFASPILDFIGFENLTHHNLENSLCSQAGYRDQLRETSGYDYEYTGSNGITVDVYMQPNDCGE